MVVDDKTETKKRFRLFISYSYLWYKEYISFKIGENSELITDNEYEIVFEVKHENKAAKASLEINKNGEGV